MTITRFAPSPNGPLHLGHAYAAIVAHDRARADGGKFLLRIEDIDGARSRDAFASSAMDDLRWLGLNWDGAAIRQSARVLEHAAALDRLRAMGLIYGCCCTRAEIAAAAKAQGPDGAIYPGTCRDRMEQGENSERQIAWRLNMAKAIAQVGPLGWKDDRHGEICATPEIFGDVVLSRRDAPGSYHLAVTCDDAADGITCITRGMDLFPATHVHRLLQSLLGLPVPIWHHHDLIAEADGRKLAKRRGSAPLADMRAAGTDGRVVADALRAGNLPDGLHWTGKGAG